MNIIVCVKPVPDVSIVSFNPKTGGIDTDDLVYIIDRCDILAVEAAIRIKENMGNCRVTLISVAHPSNTGLLRRCLAMGADEMILVWDNGLQYLDSYATGVIIAKAIAGIQCDLILCGPKAADTQAGLVGSVIAQRLDMPLISRVMLINVIVEAKKATVERKLEKGKIEKVECALPAVLTLETDLIEPRYAGLPSLIGALRKDIKQYDLKSLGLSDIEVGPEAIKTRTMALSLPRPRPKKVFTPDSQLSAQERRRLILSGGATREKEPGGFLEGNPDTIAPSIIQLLSDKKLI